MKQLILFLVLGYTSFAQAHDCYVSYQFLTADGTSSITVPDRTWVIVPAFTKKNYNNCVDEDIYDGVGSTYDFSDKPGTWLLAASWTWASNDNGQRIARFVRNPNTNPDDFGTQDSVATKGKDYRNLVYPVRINEPMIIGIEVYQSSGGNLELDFAQFKATFLQH